jgi:hypothetical protein
MEKLEMSESAMLMAHFLRGFQPCWFDDGNDNDAGINLLHNWALASDKS